MSGMQKMIVYAVLKSPTVGLDPEGQADGVFRCGCTWGSALCLVFTRVASAQALFHHSCGCKCYWWQVCMSLSEAVGHKLGQSCIKGEHVKYSKDDSLLLKASHDSQVQKSQGPAQGYKPGFLETVTCSRNSKLSRPKVL